MSDPYPPLHLSYDDNRLLALLFGQHDVHLARIEQRLGVLIRARGSDVAVSGPPDSVAAARVVMDTLWERLTHDMPVGPAEVDAALRLALGAAEERGREAALTQLSGKGQQRGTRSVSPRSATQATYLSAIGSHSLTFGVGPAGTGKTWLAVAAAVEALKNGSVDRIVLTRPAVEAGERLGFLPGDLREKIDPYLRPIYDALYDLLPAEQVVKKLAAGAIEIAPLAFMRGRTLAHCFVILDEAQNTTPMQMKMALTRLGDGSRMVVTGDTSQIDLPGSTGSGLIDALSILDGVEDVAIVRFNDADVVRHPLVARIVRAYAAREAGK